MFVLIHKNVKSKKFHLIFGVNTPKMWENHCIMCKAEYMSKYEHPSGKYFKPVPHVWEKKKKVVYFLPTG